MTTPVRNVAASVRTRLLTLAKSRNDDFNGVLRRYGVECVLRRIQASAYRDRFVLKGAMLFLVWTGRIHRPTRDLDLLGFVANDPAAVRHVFEDICRVAVDDGLDLSSATVAAERIIEAADYHGIRVKFEGRLDQARVPVQVDIGFGDIVVPDPELMEFPSLLGDSGLLIRSYPRETMVAEKVHAMVARGEENSRMKDFHDVVEISETSEFDGRRLHQAISATFRQRETPSIFGSPSEAPFYADATRSSRWQAFHTKVNSPAVPANFTEVGERIRRFVEPVIEAVEFEESFDRHWPPGGPWE
jgi:hypothetical protein